MELRWGHGEVLSLASGGTAHGSGCRKTERKQYLRSVDGSYLPTGALRVDLNGDHSADAGSFLSRRDAGTSALIAARTGRRLASGMQA